MLARIQQHVGERRTHFPRRAQRTMVISPVEHRSAPFKNPIHSPSQTRVEAFHPVGQGGCTFGLDEEVNMIVLERVMDDAEVGALRDLSQRALDFANEAHRPQGGDIRTNADRHEARRALWKLRTLAVPYPRSRRGLSPSPLPRSTPMHRCLQVQLELRSMRHTLDCGYVFRNVKR